MQQRVLLYMIVMISTVVVSHPLISQTEGKASAQVQVEVVPAFRVSLEHTHSIQYSVDTVSLDVHLRGNEDILLEIQKENNFRREELSVNDSYTLPVSINDNDNILIQMSYIKY